MNKMRYCIREKCSREKATDVIVPVHGKYIAACRVIGLTFLVRASSQLPRSWPLPPTRAMTPKRFVFIRCNE